MVIIGNIWDIDVSIKNFCAILYFYRFLQLWFYFHCAVQYDMCNEHNGAACEIHMVMHFYFIVGVKWYLFHCVPEVIKKFCMETYITYIYIYVSPTYCQCPWLKWQKNKAWCNHVITYISVVSIELFLWPNTMSVESGFLLEIAKTWLKHFDGHNRYRYECGRLGHANNTNHEHSMLWHHG